jgi:acetyl esterase/lipase
MGRAGRVPIPGWARETIAYGPAPDQRMVLTLADGGRCGEPGTDAVLFVHGGSWRTGTPEDYAFVGSWFARHGMASGVTGYRHVPESTWPAQQADVLAALVTLRERTGATRVVMAGHSAGAQLAAAALYDRDARRFAGTDDDVIVGLVAMSGPLDFGVICPQKRYCPLIAQLMDRLDDWESADPAALLRPGDIWPVLVMHGERDPVVNVASSVSFAAKAGEAGAYAQLVVRRDLGHAGLLRTFLGDGDLEGHLRGFLDAYAVRVADGPADATDESLGKDHA